MASSAQADALTEAHRTGQARIGAAVVRDLLTVWQLLDPSNIDATLERWLGVSSTVVKARQAESARLSAAYMGVLRRLELPTAIERRHAPHVPEPEAMLQSLQITGPVALKERVDKGIPWARAVELSRVGQARSGMRHALDGGRVTINREVLGDPSAVGWARVTGPDPCSFCAMLASRGPVYKADTAIASKFHDSCSCSAEPVYRSETGWPARSREYRELWDSSTADATGPEAARRAFREALTPSV